MICVNDEPADYEPGLTVARLLVRQGYAVAMVAVWINDDLVARGAYDRTPVPDQTDVRIVLMAPGG
jgi:thiamine biosynthesis protein ThiS